MNILGLDLSLNGPGFCPTPNVTASLKMDARDGDRRFVRIRDAVQHYVTTAPRLGYDLAVIESVPGGSYSTQALDGVHAVAREVLARYGVPYIYVPAPTLKAYATGDSRAEKVAMHDALPPRLRSVPRNDDEVDAWWLAAMGRAAGGDRELWSRMPEHQIDALSKLTGWPATFSPAPTGISPKTEKCGHGYQCLRNAGHLVHPYLFDECDKPAKPKSRAR